MSTAARTGDKPLACERSEWLPSEASTRRYARLVGLRHFDLPVAVAMLFAKGTPPAEVARVERCTRLLAAAGIPVPQVYASDPGQGWILQEDLGDLSLVAAAAAGADLSRLHAEALGILPRLRALRDLDTSPQPPLDAVRLRRELDLFAQAALGLDGPPGPQLAADFAALVALCTAADTVLCHRDFHARNLMWCGGRVRVIDHQDALHGPAPYDVVSLAYDPYVELDDGTRDALAGNAPHTAAVAVQRLCKAVGTYAYKGGDWRRWIAPAARQARRLMARDGLSLPVLSAALAPLTLVPA